MSLFVAGAAFGEVQVSLFLAGAVFGEIWNDSRRILSWRVILRGRRSIR